MSVYAYSAALRGYMHGSMSSDRLELAEFFQDTVSDLLVGFAMELLAYNDDREPWPGSRYFSDELEAGFAQIEAWPTPTAYRLADRLETYNSDNGFSDISDAMHALGRELRVRLAIIDGVTAETGSMLADFNAAHLREVEKMLPPLPEWPGDTPSI